MPLGFYAIEPRNMLGAFSADLGSWHAWKTDKFSNSHNVKQMQTQRDAKQSNARSWLDKTSRYREKHRVKREISWYRASMNSMNYLCCLGRVLSSHGIDVLRVLHDTCEVRVILLLSILPHSLTSGLPQTLINDSIRWNIDNIHSVWRLMSLAVKHCRVKPKHSNWKQLEFWSKSK